MRIFSRILEQYLLKKAQKIPVVALLGPRQSGKTTLAKKTFSNHRYVSLENYDIRELALEDPRKFLKIYENDHGIILDEIQHTPQLLSYIQTSVDEEHKPGYFILTGSQNILLNAAITQTLAGRIALNTLLPLSLEELTINHALPNRLEEAVFKGGYPRIYAYDLDISEWHADYIETYIERDVRQLLNIVDLSTFKRFMRLCAGRIGQTLNVTSLANDCGVTVKTVHSWISVLEASYIIFLLQPHYQNFSKRLIKSPKLYFYDTGIACSLLGIQTTDQLSTHYLRGGLVESLVTTEVFKHYFNIGKRPDKIYFWKDQSGHEIDILLEENNRLIPIEVKAGTTVSRDFFTNLAYWHNLTQALYPKGYVVYGGSEIQERAQGTLISWKNISSIL